VFRIADVPDEQEEYEKSIDGYLLEYFRHYWRVDCRCRTVEANFTKVVRKT